MPPDIHRPIAKSLTLGMLASVLLMLVGVALQVAKPESASTAILPFAEAARQCARLQASGWLSMGIFVLVLTPVVTLAVTMVSLIRLREWKTAAVAAGALAVMIAPLLLGLR